MDAFRSNTAMNYLLASVDLGSNSFRLVIGRVVHDAGVTQLYPVERMKETVRLAAGLDGDQNVDEETLARAVAVLERFGERLRSFHPDRVRAVATNTFRVANNIDELLSRSEQALGFPIEIIAGREEARLIFSGVAHSLPASPDKRLIVDIGGGSTEFVIGRAFEPERLESLPMGCVSYSRKFFPNGRIDADNMKRAEIAARREVEAIARQYRQTGWKYAYGSSGTAKALAAILPATGLSAAGITRDGLLKLKDRLIRAGTVDSAKLLDIRVDRASVLPGGLAIMLAIFRELDVEIMHAADGALRVGVLYDLLGREAAFDKRNDTVLQFMSRYEVDLAHARRVREAALALYAQVGPVSKPETSRQNGESAEVPHLLGWAADMHEIGLSIAHAAYHHHSAYILANADMPGFSKSEQHLLAGFGLGHHGKLTRPELAFPNDNYWRALLCLRLATVLFRRREDIGIMPLALQAKGRHFTASIAQSWLAEHPLTDYSLRTEQEEWRKIGFELELIET